MSIRIIRATPFIALAAGVLMAAPAFAAPDGQSTTVRYADLNLTSASGADALNGRIRRAAAAVCGQADVRDLKGIAEMQHCRTVAMNSAAPQVEMALAAARNGQTYAENGVKVRAAR